MHDWIGETAIIRANGCDDYLHDNELNGYEM